MKSIELSCLLQKCNLDGSDFMSIEKCLKEGKPCYYLHVAEEKRDKHNQAWEHFQKKLNENS